MRNTHSIDFILFFCLESLDCQFLTKCRACKEFYVESIRFGKETNNEKK
jgi:hypothetical protein